MMLYVSRLTIWIALAGAAGGVYLLAARLAGYSGFPLDDAWIHQTYARNLAESGQLAFTPGAPSAGSTAPLWTILLSLGYLLGLPYRLWTYGLGLVLLGLTGWTVCRLAGRLFPRQPGLGWWTGLFVVLEWHLVWAAVSGMETMLFVWLSVLLVERYLAQGHEKTPAQPPPATERDDLPPVTGGSRGVFLPPVTGGSRGVFAAATSRLAAPFGWGLLGGLLILTRPEGVGLVGLLGLDMARRWRQADERQPGRLLSSWLGLGAGAAVLILPYVAFHLYLTGLPFPNTLYAKQAEYGLILSEFSLWQRLFGGLGPPVDSVQGVFRVIFVGPQLLLLPGLMAAGWLTVKERRVELWFIWAWWLSYLLLYGLRLPVTYQHGRYQMPAIVWVILLGLWGTFRLAQRLRQRGAPGRVLSRAWLLSLGLLVLAFIGIGAQAYARDVRIIESEMVATAHWLSANTPPDALLAVHDIGAIGYFTTRPIIDLAGLVTPEVIPIIRDEAALLQFVRDRRAAYLVTFPSWYPAMVRHPALEPVFVTGSPWAPRAGGDNMVVYRLDNARQ